VQGKGHPIFWRAVIDADLKYEKRTVRFRFVFDKEDGHWVLYGFERL
jgi:hypothetical protein